MVHVHAEIVSESSSTCRENEQTAVKLHVPEWICVHMAVVGAIIIIIIIIPY